MPNFNLLHDRDAWFAIGGFVYQVHRTIDRWLLLQANEIRALDASPRLVASDGATQKLK
jgi:hypothetical protein